MENLQKIT